MGTAGILQTFVIFSEAVVEFRGHSASHSQFEGVFLPLADADGFSYILYALCRLLGGQTDACEGVERVGYAALVTELPRRF